MNRAAESIPSGKDPSSIPDLRGIPLGQLADEAADPEGIVNDMVLRLLDGIEGSARVAVMSFNSAI